MPPYYANPGSNHPAIPTDPCNPSPGFPEDFAGSTLRLDNDGDGGYDGAESDCSTQNSAPVADAGPDQTVGEGAQVTLDGSNSSDPDDGIASYLWEQTAGPVVSLSDPSAVQPTFTTPVVGPDGGSLTFRLTVTDNGGLQSTDTVLVNISVGDVSPIADAGPNQTVDEGTTVTLDGSNSTDPGGGVISYLWTQKAGREVTLSDPTAGTSTFVTPPVDTGGATLTFELTVANGSGLRASDEVSVTIEDNRVSVFPDNAVPMLCSTGEFLGAEVRGDARLTHLNPVDPSTLPDTSDRPGDLVYGLIDMEIKVETPGDVAEVRFHLPTAAPEGYRWYKYSPTQGWVDYTANVSFNDDRDRVTLTLVDGGIGDDDGVANGMIVDPSGLRTLTAAGGGDAAPVVDTNHGGGCFISTALSGHRAD